MAGRRLYIIAGCNGAGKTTAARQSLLDDLQCSHWVSDDDIAYSLSPQAPEQAFARAARMMIERIGLLLDQGETFALETTLAPRCFSRTVMQARQQGYDVSLLFFHLPSPQAAIDRVSQRVSQGGRYVPDEVVTRHYHAGLRNLRQLYMPIVDRWRIFCIKDDTHQLVAMGRKGETIDLERLAI